MGISFLTAIRGSRRRLVWGGNASMFLVIVIAALHAGALVWMFSSRDRLRLVTFDFHEVPNESFMMTPPEGLRAFGYVEDDVASLRMFADIARPILQGAPDDAERLRRLGDYIYALRTSHTQLAEDERGPLLEMFAKVRSGQAADCGQMSKILSAFWRSLGGHSRLVQWTTVEGVVGHVSVELYSSSYRRWIYYDMNVNGYFKEDDGRPLSSSAVRVNLLTDQDVHLVANEDARFHEWTSAEFQEIVHEFPVEWYSLNNTPMALEPNRRFGVLNPFYPLLVRLPAPAGAALDNLTGARDRRLVVDGKVQIGNLLTFQGVRLFLAWCLVMLALCFGTLVRYVSNPRLVDREAGRMAVGE
jgi:hypothetical protein